MARPAPPSPHLAQHRTKQERAVEWKRAYGKTEWCEGRARIAMRYGYGYGLVRRYGIIVCSIGIVGR